MVMLPSRHKRKVTDKSKTLCNIWIEGSPTILLTENTEEVTCGDCRKRINNV